jgi:hypothetical protein
MLERQKERIAKAQSEGKYRGRAPTARAKADQDFALDRAGKTREAIAKEAGISLVSALPFFLRSWPCNKEDTNNRKNSGQRKTGPQFLAPINI